MQTSGWIQRVLYIGRFLMIVPVLVLGPVVEHFLTAQGTLF